MKKSPHLHRPYDVSMGNTEVCIFKLSNRTGFFNDCETLCDGMRMLERTVQCKKKVTGFQVPSRDVTNQTLSGR
jgi:hypothetical protein